jgi:hypothetical protein
MNVVLLINSIIERNRMLCSFNIIIKAAFVGFLQMCPSWQFIATVPTLYIDYEMILHHTSTNSSRLGLAVTPMIVLEFSTCSDNTLHPTGIVHNIK